MNKPLAEQLQRLHENQLKAKFPELYKVVAKDAMDIAKEADEVIELKLPNGEVIFRVVTPGHSYYYSLKKGWIGEEDEGLDGEYSKFNKALKSIEAKGKSTNI